MADATRSARRRLLDALQLRRGEGAPVALLFAWSFCVVGAFFIGRTARDTLFLSHLPATRLPYLYIASPLCVTAVGLLHARIADRIRRDRLLIMTGLASAVALVATRVALGAGDFAYYLLYVLVEVVGALSIVQFWTTAGDRFTARRAKQVFALVAAGGTLANIVLGVALTGIARFAGAENLVLLQAALLAAGVALVLLLRRGAGGRLGGGAARPRRLRSAGAEERWPPGSGHLRWMAPLIACTVVTVTLLDFRYKTIVAAHFAGDRAAMVRFFGALSAATGVVSFAMQLCVTGRLLARAGVAGALLVLPLSLGGGALGLLLAPMLATAALSKAADATFRYTVNDAGQQLLYLPVPSWVRGRLKGTLDGVVKPGSEAASGLLLLAYRFLTLPLWPLAAAALLLVGLWTAVVVRLRGAYVASLRETLRRRRAPALDDETELPAEASPAVRRALASADEQEVLHALEVAPTVTEDLTADVARLLAHARPAVRRAACLHLAAAPASPARYAAALRALVADPDPSVRPAAVRALCRAAPAEVEADAAALLADADAATRLAAIVGLLRHGGERAARAAGESLVELAGSRDSDRRVAAAEAIGDARLVTFEDHLAALLADAEPEVRAAAVAAAAAIATPELIRPLAALLAGAEATAAAAALAACGPDVEPVMAALLDDDAADVRARRAAARVLAAAAGPGAAALLAARVNLTAEPVRDAVCHALAQLARRAPGRLPRDRLAAACRAELTAAFTALAASEGLGRAETTALADGTRRPPPFAPGQPPGAAALLGLALRERSERARDRMLWLLAVLHPEVDVDAVHAGLVDPEPARRANAVELLDSTLRDPLRRLIVLLVDESPRAGKVQAATAPLALPRLAHDGWVLALLADASPWMATCAAYYAGACTVGAAEGALLAHLRHPSPIVREAALEALERLLPWARLAPLAAPALADDFAPLRRRAERIVDTAGGAGDA